jgi:hypothetical protein
MAIYISDKIIVGAGSGPTTAAVHVELVPDTKTKKVKLERVRKQKFVQDYTNTPLPGFTIVKPGRSSWSGTKTSWTVIDPRGFITEISSENLEQIISCSSISEGLIQERCVWGYDGAENVLLPVNSDPYALAQTNTNIISTVVPLKDVKIGDKVILHDKFEGIYYGSWNVIMESNRYADSAVFDKTARRYLFKYVNKAGATCYLSTSGMKVSRISEVADEEIPKDVARKELQAALDTRTSIADYVMESAPRSYSRLDYIYFLESTKEKLETRLVEVDATEFDRVMVNCVNLGHGGRTMYVEKDSLLYNVAIAWSIQHHTPSMLKGSRVSEITSGGVSFCTEDSGYRYGSSKRMVTADIPAATVSKHFILEYVSNTQPSFIIGA